MACRVCMGKRSSFSRVADDFYPTPLAAVLPLLPHLSRIKIFAEPCAGDGSLVRHLASYCRCVHASDVRPKGPKIAKLDAFHLRNAAADCFITNPPWDRAILHPLIDHLRVLLPTWLLIDADWMHTKQAAPHLRYCRKIVSVGRVKWIADSPYSGKDNCCWYLFGKVATPTTFVGPACAPSAATLSPSACRLGGADRGARAIRAK